MACSNSLRGAFAKNVKTVTYVAILVVLTSMAVTDVVKILKDYLYENRYTLVKLEKINNTFPFIDNPTVCVYRNVIFHEMWNMTDEEQNKFLDFAEFGRRILSNDTRLFSNFSDSMQLSLQERVDNSRFFEMIWVLETTSDNLRGFHSEYSRYLGVNESETRTILDKFLTNPRVEQLIEKTWQKIRPSVASGNNIWLEKMPPAILQSLASSLACFVIPLDDYLELHRKEARAVSFDLGALRFESSVAHDLGATVTIEFPDLSLNFDNKFDTYTRLALKITNTGIHDRTDFKPCTAEFKTEADCFDDLKWRTISEMCRCTPFMYKIFLKTKKLVRKNDEPLCTALVYETCFDKALEEFRKRKMIADVCTPCVVSKNKYLEIYETPKKYFAKAVDVSFDCTDSFYVVFQEKQQFSFSQLISQIGGDLGLYVGFSMVSLVQFSAYIYNVYKNKRNFDDKTAPSKNMWKQVITRHIRNGGHYQSGEGEAKQNYNDFKQKIQNLETGLVTLEKGHSEMRVDIWHTRQVLERLEQRLLSANKNVTFGKGQKCQRKIRPMT